MNNGISLLGVLNILSVLQLLLSVLELILSVLELTLSVLELTLSELSVLSTVSVQVYWNINVLVC